MKPSPLEYYRADTVADALTVLAQADGAGRLLSGGQSLVPMLNLRLMPVSVLIDIKRIAALLEVHEDERMVRYGACVTHACFEDGRVPDALNGLLRHVGAGIAYRAVRNRGTLGGALALADASADWVTALMGAGATVTLCRQSGSRQLPLTDFVHGPYVTALEPDAEILSSVEVPRLTRGGRWGYYKIMQKPGEYASALAAVVIDGARDYSRVVLGGANRAPVLLARTARLLSGATAWSGAVALDVEREARADLIEAGRLGEPAQVRGWLTSIQRAAQGALES